MCMKALKDTYNFYKFLTCHSDMSEDLIGGVAGAKTKGQKRSAELCVP